MVVSGPKKPTFFQGEASCRDGKRKEKGESRNRSDKMRKSSKKKRRGEGGLLFTGLTRPSIGKGPGPSDVIRSNRTETHIVEKVREDGEKANPL